MSYILDALRRADAERERGAVPGIHAQPVPQVSLDAGARRGRLPVAWMAAGGAVLVAGVLGWQLARERSEPPPTVAAAPAQPERPTTADPSPAAPQAPSPAAAPAPAPAPVRSAAPLPAPAPARATPAPRPAASPAPQAVAGRRDAAPPAARTPAAAVAPRPLPQDVAPAPPPPRDARVAAAPPTGTAALPPSAQAPAAPPQSGADRVVRLHELPPDVRSRLPQMSIGGSRYSPDPAKRFLIVNGLLLREREPLTPEVTLEEIQLRGAILRIGDWRFAISY